MQGQVAVNDVAVSVRSLAETGAGTVGFSPEMSHAQRGRPLEG